jgi:hypothetical protein
MLTWEMHRINAESDPFRRFVMRKAFWHGFFSFYPPMWWSSERRMLALRPHVQRWVKEYDQDIDPGRVEK